jgi:hypothetical protein
LTDLTHLLLVQMMARRGNSVRSADAQNDIAMKTLQSTVLTCATLVLVASASPVQSSVVITYQPLPPIEFQGVTVYSPTPCDPPFCTPDYSISWGSGSPVTYLSGSPTSSPLMFDASGTIGPTHYGQHFLPYTLGYNFAGDYVATLSTDPLPNESADIRFAIIAGGPHGADLSFQSVSTLFDMILSSTPGELRFSPIDGWDYYAVVYGTLTEPLNYRLTVASVPIPAAVWLFGSSVVALFGALRRVTAR